MWSAHIIINIDVCIIIYKIFIKNMQNTDPTNLDAQTQNIIFTDGARLSIYMQFNTLLYIRLRLRESIK